MIRLSQTLQWLFGTAGLCYMTTTDNPPTNADAWERGFARPGNYFFMPVVNQLFLYLRVTHGEEVSKNEK